MDPAEREAGARALALRVHQSRLVLFFEELDALVVWNGSQTFNVVALSGEDIDTFMSEYPVDVDQAKRMIEQHMKGWS